VSIDDAITILESDGFEEIGRMSYGGITVYHFWNSSLSVEACLAQGDEGGPFMLKAQMHFYLKAVENSREIFGRDLEPFIQACEATFPELHLQFSIHRDLPDEAIARRVKELNPRGVMGPTEVPRAAKELDETRREHDEGRQTLESCLRVAKHLGGAGLLESYMRQKPGRMQHEVSELEAKARSLATSIERTQKYIKAYRKHGRGAAAIFCAASNLHIVHTNDEFRNALRAAVKEVTDADKYVIRAKLGGRLRVFVETLRHPALAYAFEFAGGIPNLRQLSSAGAAFKPILDAAVACTMVAPCRDIVIDDATKDDKKSIGPRFLKAVIDRVDKTNAQSTVPQQKKPVMPAFLGMLIGTEESFVVGLENLGHFAIIGPTGCGKTFNARVLVEEGVQNGITVIVIDPRDQWAGLALPEDRGQILERYAVFEMDRREAKGYPIAYYAPGDSVGLCLPEDLSRLALAKGVSVVSVQSLDDRERCMLLGNILQAVFKTCCAQGESTVPRVWILIEEFHNFVPQKVADNAKSQAKRAISIFDTVRREGRKFGLFTGFIATSFRDAGGVLASTSRLNTNTLIAFRTHDRDLQYVSSFIDPKRLGQLGQYEAYLCCPQGNYQFVTRPPYSKVSHVPDELRGRLFGRGKPSRSNLTEDELKIMNAASEHHIVTGEYLNVAGVMRAVDIRSKRKLELLIRNLEDKGYITTQRLTGQRGSPRIIIPLTASGDGGANTPDETRDETRTKW